MTAHLLSCEASGGCVKRTAVGGVLSDLESSVPPCGVGAFAHEGHGSIEIIVLRVPNLSGMLPYVGLAGTVPFGPLSCTVEDGET